MLTNNLVIPIHQYMNLIFPTKIKSRVEYIISRIFSLQIFNKFDSFLRKTIFIDKFYCSIESIISRHIINKHYMIIMILLLKNRKQILDISIILDIIMAQNSHTKWELFLPRLFYLIMFIEVWVLFGLKWMIFREINQILKFNCKLHFGNG